MDVFNVTCNYFNNKINRKAKSNKSVKQDGVAWQKVKIGGVASQNEKVVRQRRSSPPPPLQ
jgi:hypothetical protein